MSLENLTLTLIAMTMGSLFVLERLSPRRILPEIPFWTLRGFLVSAVAFVLSMKFPLLWDAWLAPYQLVDGTGLGVLGGALVGAAFLELLNYFWHRTLHRTPLLWRWFHQMHHSSERIDIASVFYFSPIDMLGWSAVGSLALVLGLGLVPEAAIIAVTGLTLLNIFSHANIRTPRWLGWFIVRPEMHAVHHQRGVHRYNYGALPIWDLLFGTYQNPKHHVAEAGFYDGASARIPEMLVGRIVSRQKPAARFEEAQAPRRAA